MGKAPKPTPPKETSAASTSTNVATAIANSYMSNFNEYGPDGSRVFRKTGDQRVHDPYTNETYSIPTFDVTTTLSDAQKRIKTQQDRASENLAGLAAEQSGFLRGYMDRPFQYGAGEHEQWAGQTYDRLNQGRNAAAEESLASRLANQGIAMGSDAYDSAMSSLHQGQQSARDQFMLDSHQTGFQMAQAQRNQPINEITALMSGGQVSAPAFSTQPNQVTMPTTDNAAIIGNYDRARAEAHATNMNNLWGGIKTIGGLFGLSDERVKEGKKKIGETEDGLGLYKFRFKGSGETQVGLMAQEVAKKKPGAVMQGPDGLLRVNYEEALK